MERRRLGHSELEVSVVGLGCNQFGRKLDLGATRSVIDAALDAGINFLDTADVYGGGGRSEELMGEVLQGRRDRVVLGTKFGLDMTGGDDVHGGASYVRKAVEDSLRRLRTDVIDLYWYHRPDPRTPIAETLAALDELVRAGTVRAIACSNFSARELEDADMVARENGLPRFVAIQNEYSLLRRDIENDVVPVCERLGVSVVPYFPLARGLLTGKYRREAAPPEGSRLAGNERVASDAEFDVIEGLERFAADRGLPTTTVAIAALAAQPAVASVICGATRADQVAANAAAARWRPAATDLAEIDAIAPPRSSDAA